MKKVYVIGDSISIHYGPYLEKYLKGFMSYARKEGVEQSLQNLDIPQGANGGDSSNVLAYLEYKLKSGGIDADVLLLNCGMHDIKTDPVRHTRQVSLEKYEENLKKILPVVDKLKVRLVWIRTAPFDEKVHNTEGMKFFRFSADGINYNAVADRVMRSNNIPVIDLYTFTVNLGDNLYCDHAHFHEHIREKQGAFIAGWLTAYVKIAAI